MAFHALGFVLLLSFLLGCEKPVIESPISETISVVKPTPTPSNAIIADAPSEELSLKSKDLIVEYEVGGVAQYNRYPYPEAPDARYSGITEGVGYDNHQNSAQMISLDWVSLGGDKSKRLANTHPYYGRSAQAHLKDVQDIMVPWTAAFEVFKRVDVARTFDECRKTFPGFDNLRPNAKGALCSLVFNRGNSMTGDGRREMRHIRDYDVPRQDYSGIAQDIRSMKRLWRGTEIEHGMSRRRDAEAKLVETL